MSESGLHLAAGDAKIAFHREFPGVAQYVSKSTGAHLRGAAPGGFQVVLLDRSAGEYRACTEPGSSLEVHVRSAADEVSYAVTASLRGLPCARIAITARVDANGLHLASEIVEEAGGYEVASVLMEVFRVPRELPGAAMAFANRCGRLVSLRAAKPEKVTHYVDWYEPVPVAIAYHSGILGLLTLDTVDNQIVHEVRETEGSVSVELVHRHKVLKPANSFLAQETASCLVRVVAPTKGSEQDWTAGAALARDDVAANLSGLYVGKLIYKVMLQVAHAGEVTTYDDTLALIRRVARLTGGVEQIVYLVGWQHHGHDTGYPDVYTANARVGSFEDFKALKEAAKAENAIVSLHDNYHDAYMDSPLWDPGIVCVNPDGELRKGGIWGGGQAYEIGPTKYVNQARERAERTVSMMGLEKTTHLDVLSDKPNMVDFDLVAPANREQNATAKHEIVDAFRRFGVDVTSEVLTSPFVPFMHHFWHAIVTPAKEWSAEQRIPLVPFIYHGKVTAGGDVSSDADVLDHLEYGLTFSIDWNKDTPDEEIADPYYLVALPWGLLARREIVGFERVGDWDKVLYGPDSFVRVNRAANSYEVVVDGVLIAADYATFAERSPGEWLVYAREARTVRLPVSGDVEVVSLLGGPSAAVTATPEGIEFRAEPRVPYRVKALNA